MRPPTRASIAPRNSALGEERPRTAQRSLPEVARPISPLRSRAHFFSSVLGGGLPDARRFTRRFRRSNQNGAPRDTASAVRSHPSRCSANHDTVLRRSAAPSPDQPNKSPNNACSSANTELGLFVASAAIGAVGLGLFGSVYSTVSNGGPCSSRALARSTTYARNVGFCHRLPASFTVSAFRMMVNPIANPRIHFRDVRL